GLVPESATDYAWDAGASGFSVGLGQLYKITDDQGWLKRSYDDRGRLVKESRRLSTNSTTYTMLYEYDEANRPTKATYPGGSTVTTEYDIAGHVTAVKSGVGVPGGPLTFYSSPAYDAEEALTSMHYGNGVVTNVDYYAVQHAPKHVVAGVSGSSPLMDLTY